MSIWYRESKYHNKKSVYDGKKFDSKKEMYRYQELALLEKAGGNIRAANTG